MAYLNEAQEQAVLHKQGPCLVLAGAGTGKTRVLVERTANLVRNETENILLVTFTNKAAKEMHDRVLKTLNVLATKVQIGTFHATCAKILRRHAHLLNLSPEFSIIDTDDQLKLMKQILSAYFVDEKDNVKRIAFGLQRFKDQGLNPCDVTDDLMRGIYTKYQERLKILNAVDFGDIILLAINLFKENPRMLERYQNLFEYVMVDEYQDTNTVQYLWLRLLAQQHTNLFCVGDEDQSIYAWRGAEIGNILRFDKDFHDAKVIRLEQNYRSTHHITSAASSLIANNKARLGKNLFSERTTDQKVIIHGTWDTEDEARLVYEFIMGRAKEGIPLSKMAILVRASFQTRPFEERFLKLNLPYEIVGGTRFYERQEIKDVIAYLRVVTQPDDGLAFERILNLPKRSVGLTSIRRINEIAHESGISFTEASKIYMRSDGKQPSKISLNSFFNQIIKWREYLNVLDHVKLTEMILEESGYLNMWRENKSQEGVTRYENLKELLVSLKDFGSLREFLDHVSLVTETAISERKDCIRIMTLHGAKGLEFDTVFLPGWEEGLFPHQRSVQENGEKGIEEERRLAYVGISRAIERVWITYTMQRCYYHSWQTNVPSRFLKELNQKHIIHYNPNGVEIDKTPTEGDFIIGQRVYHEKYGYGDIIDLDLYGLYIKFDYAGVKKIAQRFIAKAC